MESESRLLPPELIFQGEWGSEFKPTGSTTFTPEGKFICLENTARAILGTFVPDGGGPPRDILTGKREPPVTGTKHRVMLVREDDNFVYLYIGHAFLTTGLNAKAEGRRLKITKPTALTLTGSGDMATVAALAVADDDWIGTRPPT